MATYSSTSINTSGQGTSQVASDRGSNTATINNRYSDLNLQMIPHPQKNDIIPLKGELAVKNAVKNLLLTNFFERPFNSTLGANLRGLLFEPNDAITRISLRSNIRRCIQNFEPRVIVNGVNIQDNSERNAYNATVHFIIKEFDRQASVDIELRRLR